MRKSQAQTLQKLRQRGAKTVSSSKSNGPVQSGHAHGHRLNVAELKLHLKDVIWEKTQGDKSRIKRLFRNFQDSLVRNGITFQSFVYGLQTCGLRSITQEEEWALFNTCDKDGSGIINLKDFIKEFRTQKKPKSKTHSTDLFKKELDRFISKTKEQHVNNKMNMSKRKSNRKSQYKVFTKSPSNISLEETKTRSNASMSRGNSISSTTLDGSLAGSIETTSSAYKTNRSSYKPRVFSMPKLSRAWDIDKSESLYSVKQAPFGSRCM